MKRIVILIAVALVSSVALFADEVVVIDFNKLNADTPSDKPINNMATIVDFSKVAGTSFTDAEKAMMKSSLAIEKWSLVHNTSTSSILCKENTYAKTAKIKDSAIKYAKESIMGVRILYPDMGTNAYVDIMPPFELPVYADKDTLGADGKLTVAPEEVGKGVKFDGYGVVKNIGVVKSISVNVYGLNYANGLSVIMKDQNNNPREYFMGYLDFDGWQTLTWNNPNYIDNVQKREASKEKLYPNSDPYLKLASFRIYKNAMVPGGDFISYIKDVSMIFDKAVSNHARDIDDEALWNIIQDRDNAERDISLKRLGIEQVERYLEKRRMDNPADRAPGGSPPSGTAPTSSTPAAGTK